MPEQVRDDSWIYVVVMDPEDNPQYLGQQDEEAGVAYIPAFLQKEDAQQAMLNLSLQKGRKYEVQAVMYDQLNSDAAANGFSVFILSSEGAILEKSPPAGVR